MYAQPRAFALNVADTAITDLRGRLARTRFPDQAPGEPWAYGTNVDYLRGLVEYWRTGFPYYFRMHRPWPIPEGGRIAPTRRAMF